MAVALLSCMSMASSNWTEHALSSSDFTGKAIARLASSTVLVGGELRGSQDSAALYRWSDGSGARVYAGTGRIIALSAANDKAFALLQQPLGSVPGSDYALLTSGDDGATWGAPVPILLPHLDQLVAVNGSELWVMGEALSRSLDGGVTWREVAAPGRRNLIKERLAVEGSTVWLLGEATHMSTDQGRSWISEQPGAQVVARDGAVEIGVRENAAVWRDDPTKPWTALPIPAGSHPAAVDDHKGAIRMALTPPPESQAGGLFLLEREQAATTWTTTRVPGAVFEPAVLLEAGEGYSVNPFNGTLWVREP